MLLLMACSPNPERLPYYTTPDFTPHFLRSDVEVREKVTHTIGSFALTDQTGATITQRDIEGKIHVANFIFTSCVSICPVMTKHMKLVQNAFSSNPDVVLLSYSVTPWIDDVPRLQQFAQKHAIVSPNWHLLTGRTSAIYTLARQSYFAEEDLGYTKDSSQFLHTEHVLLVDKHKRIRGIYNGTLQLEAEQLIQDIKQLMQE
jgi:protein SCO1